MPKKLIYWSPRILLILFILFLALFSLDVFDEAAGFWQTALALLMHNLPSLILTVILIKQLIFQVFVIILKYLIVR